MFEDFSLEVELVDENAKMPIRATDGDVGMDFFTPIRKVIFPGDTALIPLGLKTRFSKGYGLIFFEKSGIAVKKKSGILAKVIDPGYRGILHAHLMNNSREKVIFEIGDKVVQAVVMPVWTGHPILVDSIENDSERGEGGFGSTGR